MGTTPLISGYAPSDSWSDDDAITPGRSTSVTFDVELPVITGSATRIRRAGHQIASVASRDKHKDSRFTQGIHLWSSGATTLRPLQFDMSKVQAKGLPAGLTGSFLYGPGATGTMAVVTAPLVAASTFNPATGPGLSAPVGGNLTGDPHYQRIVPSGSSWGAGSPAVAIDVSSIQSHLENSIGSALTQPLDPLLRTVQNQEANQGLCLRWSVPGAGLQTHDVISTLHFGQYAVAFAGNGDAQLWEYCRPIAQAGAVPTWNKRKTFQYCRPNQVTGHQHQIVVYPLVGANGERLLHFAITDLSASETGSSGLVTAPNAQSLAGHSTGAETVFKWDPLIDGGYDESPGNATKAAPFTLQARRDIRMHFQLSRLLFEQVGNITDHQMFVGDQTGTRQPFQIANRSLIPNGTAIDHKLYDATTGLTTGIITRPYAVFNFSGDGKHTPALWHHTLTQAPNIATPPVSAFTTTYQEVSIQGTDGDPRHEHATVTIMDPADAYPRLRNRGHLSARIQTEYTPPTGGQTIKVPLFRGYAERPHRTKIGKVGTTEGFQSATPSVFPSPDWSAYTVALTGMWQRLTEVTSRTATAWHVFAVDDNAPPDPLSGSRPAWKVTDVIRYLLNVGGFDQSMINIPDITAIRLQPGYGTGAEDIILSAATNIPDQLISLTRGYLGQYLYFDETSGAIQSDGYPIGQWILIQPPLPGATPVWNFVSDNPVVPGAPAKLRWVPGSTPINTSVTLHKLESYIAPPEANHLVMLTIDTNSRTGGGFTYQQHIYNAASYAVPGFTNQVDPDNPNYLGHEKALYCLELGLWAGDANAQATQTAVDYLTRRYYDYVCQARRIQPILAPLDFIQDPTTGRYRKMRFYDPVTWNGQTGWYVRSCSPRFHRDRWQVADYELERIEPYPMTTGTAGGS